MMKSADSFTIVQDSQVQGPRSVLFSFIHSFTLVCDCTDMEFIENKR